MIEKLTIFMPKNFEEAMIVQDREKINEIIEQQIRDRKDIEDLYNFIKTLNFQSPESTFTGNGDLQDASKDTRKGCGKIFSHNITRDVIKCEIEDGHGWLCEDCKVKE